MAINFPNAPSVGDEYTAGGFTWVWTGSTWEKVSEATAVDNDFVLVVGATGNTTYVLDRTYSAGVYAIDFVNNDTTYDIYFIAENGTYAGYTNNALAQVTADFNEVVVLGATNNETILFSYQGAITSPSTAGDVATAGAYITSVVTAALPNIDDTTVVNGGNFAANVAVSFIGQNAAETAAKTVVRNSSTQLIATRPDNFAPAQSPYTVKVLNPGIPAPTGSNRHLLSNAVTAGAAPSWVTETTVLYSLAGATSITLLATDAEGSDIDYSIVSGSLPAGLSLDGETGVISGTFSGAANEGDVTSVTVRATDTGGNFLDRTFSFTANAAPVWTTAAGALAGVYPQGAYSVQLVASGGSAGGALTYSLQSGTLPTGITLSSAGLLSGTSNNTAGVTFSFTVRVSDAAGLFTDRAFSILITDPEFYTLLASGSIAGGTGFTVSNINHSLYSHYDVYLNYVTSSPGYPTFQVNGASMTGQRHDLGKFSSDQYNYAYQNNSGTHNFYPIAGNIGNGEKMDALILKASFLDKSDRRKVYAGVSSSTENTSDSEVTWKFRLDNSAAQVSSFGWASHSAFAAGSTFEIYGLRK